MKIGIWLSEKFIPTEGGGASYTNRLLTLIDNYNFSKGIEICYVSFFSNEILKHEVYNISQIPAFLLNLCSFSQKLTDYLLRINYRLIRVRGLSSVLKHTDIKIMYYIQQATLLDSSFPFIATNWDIGHRSTFAFPEFILYNTFESRDNFYFQKLPKALIIICESEAGKQELQEYANIGAHKIRIMPIFAGGVSSLQVSEDRMREILDRMQIRKYKYFYYPAQFWAHKNHVGLLCAFKEYISICNADHKLIFSGSDKGNLEYVKSFASQIGLNDNVVFLGFISEEEVYTLYKNAICLVMASHFGPTNMPPIEAMELGCPVACSDLSGHHEILEDGAAYFDSFNPSSICRAMTEIVKNRDIYVAKIQKQKEKSKFNPDYSIHCLDKILLEAIDIRSNWA